MIPESHRTTTNETSGNTSQDWFQSMVSMVNGCQLFLRVGGIVFEESLVRRNTSQTGISLEQTETKESLQPRSTMKH